LESLRRRTGRPDENGAFGTHHAADLGVPWF